MYILQIYFTALSNSIVFTVNSHSKSIPSVIAIENSECSYLLWQLEMSVPGSVARYQTSFTDSMFFSFGACRTILVDPTTQRTQPRTPNMWSFSSKTKCASTALHENRLREKQDHILIEHGLY